MIKSNKKYQEYLNLKQQQVEIQKKIDNIEREEQLFQPLLTNQIINHLTNKYNSLLSNVDIKVQKQIKLQKYKIIVTCKFNDNIVKNNVDSKNYLFVFDMEKPFDKIVSEIQTEIDTELMLYYLYNELSKNFKKVKFERNNNKITCREHNTYKSLSIIIDLTKNELHFSQEYYFTNSIQIPLKKTVKLNELRISGNVGMSIIEEIDHEIKLSKTIKVKMV